MCRCPDKQLPATVWGLYMDNLNPTMDIILIMAILRLYVHIPRLHVAQHRLIKDCSLRFLRSSLSSRNIVSIATLM